MVVGSSNLFCFALITVNTLAADKFCALNRRRYHIGWCHRDLPTSPRSRNGSSLCSIHFVLNDHRNFHEDAFLRCNRTAEIIPSNSSSGFHYSKRKTIQNSTDATTTAIKTANAAISKFHSILKLSGMRAAIPRKCTT